MKMTGFLAIFAFLAIAILAAGSANACGDDRDKDRDKTEWEGSQAMATESIRLAQAGLEADSTMSFDVGEGQPSKMESDRDTSRDELTESSAQFEGSTVSPSDKEDYSIRLIDEEVELDTPGDEGIDLDAPDIDVPDLDVPDMEDTDIGDKADMDTI